jgi:hypothetical protein
MDICLLISGMKHMSSRWIQPLGVSLDAQLKERGIGMEKRNRFCFIQFGARGIDIRAKFVDQFEGFYGSDQLGLIRKALKSNGFVADGYQAIQFALDNVPFRTDPDVGKSIILVTNAGRTSLATSSNLTLIPMRDMLLKSNFSIDVIVNMTLPQTAIGFNSSHLMGYSSADSSSYTTSSISTLPVSQSHSNTLSSYVGLSLESNGGVWTLDAIKDTNASLISALSVAMVNGWSILDDTSCHACSCNNICTTPILQSSCKSCVNSTSKKCLQSMTDKVSQVYQVVELYTSVTQGKYSNRAEVSFYSNREDVLYHCLHFNSSNNNPVVPSLCTSPWRLTQLIDGTHLVLITASTPAGGIQTAKILKFEVAIGPVVISFGAPNIDHYGVMSIPILLSRTENVRCFCSSPPVNSLCSGVFVANPKYIQPGPRTLDVMCADADGWISREKFDFIMGPAVEIPTTPLHCSLSISHNISKVSANFKCNREVNTNCSIANSPYKKCDSVFTFSTAAMPPGTYPFSLRATDHFNNKYGTVIPFTVERANRKCCPQILTNDTSLSSDGEVTVSATISSGNCSISEGFSYNINWDNGSITSGSSPYHQPILTLTHSFKQSHQYTITLNYCNNPTSSNLICCSHLTIPLSVTS